MTETRIDAFLGGALQIEQPLRGYRAGADAVMLAAACAARPGESVLELGCGAGVAALCLASRVTGVDLWAVERDALFAALARDNAARNGAKLSVVQADLADLPPALRGRNFDHVMLNPPFFAAGTPSPDSLRAHARHEETPLTTWLDCALRRLRPGGHVTLIHLASRLDKILTLLAGRAGAVAILPISARRGRAAGRVIVQARKGSAAGLRLLYPFIMHQAPGHAGDAEDLTAEAQAVLRHNGAISLIQPE